MSAPDDSIEVNALDLLATPALLDEAHINDVSDSDNSFKVTLQTIIELYNDLAVTMTGKNIVATQLTGIIADARMPNLTGDITTSEGAVATTIAAKAVEVAMLADGTDGELITWGADAVATTVAVGTSGNVLTSNGAGSPPTFQAGGAGDMVLADAQTNTGIKTFLDTTMKLRNVANTFDGYFVNTNTADRIYTLPDEAGTISLIARTETLVGKTLTTPTISGTGFTNAQHAHTGATSGGTITEASISDLGTSAALVADNLSVFAATTSAQLAGVLSDETGSGLAVFGTSPTLITPALGTPSALVLTNATGLPVTGLANGTDGELITWSATGVAETVAVGSANEVLTSNGAGAAPTFQAAAGGGDMVLADAQTVTGAKTFADDAFLIQNPATTFEYLFQGGAILADRTITLPVLTATSTLAFADFANAWGTQNQNISATGKWQEGGVSISPIGVHDIWVGATAMWPATTLPCSDLTKTELGTNDVDIQTLDFATGADEFAQFSMALPRNFDNATITFEIHWSAASGSGTVSWDVAALARSEGDPLDAAFTDETTVTDTLTTADDLHISPTSADMSLTGHVDGDYIHFRVRRDVSDDTLGVDAKLLGIHFHITTDAAVAA